MLMQNLKIFKIILHPIFGLIWAKVCYFYNISMKNTCI